ncbi:MAG: hypothetical protein KDK45_17375, partial [Leptospiraceae bacterium]|nr:hypothetical protein [Leptospiraceae bacterium]
SFFQKDIKRALAYSTIENSNFLWLSLLIYLFWVVDPNPEIQKLALAYLVVFYISIIHHSVSKTYQFLSLGYLAKIASSTDTDECKGVGRVSGLSFLASSVGSLSFAMVPGTIGFFSESTFLYLGSIVIDMPVTRSLLILPSLIFISTGLAMGAFSHVKLFLSLMLSVPRKQIEPQTPSAFLTYSLNSLGILILLLPVIAWIPFYIQPELKEILPGLFQTWVFKLSFISLFVIVVSLFLIYSKFRHKIWKRQIWDCGSNYRGEDVSIPGSVISDPLFPSVGRFLLNKTGDAKLDSLFLSLMNKLLGFGRYWIHFFETGELTTYLFLSSISLLFSVGVLLLYQKLFAGM